MIVILVGAAQVALIARRVKAAGRVTTFWGREILAEPATDEITAILRQIGAGDQTALARLATILYDELRDLAARQMRGERWDHTIQPTALVHEAYLRLFRNRKLEFQDRAQFFGAAAEVMRRVLVDHARKHLAAKRGGQAARVALNDGFIAGEETPDQLIAIDDALSRLAEVNPEFKRIVELRFFSGLSVEEVATMIGSSPRTVKRKWRFAKAWLYRAIEGRESLRESAEDNGPGL
jgi:RNA polymerase sigma factor (TIGR02999 family)